VRPVFIVAIPQFICIDTIVRLRQDGSAKPDFLLQIRRPGIPDRRALKVWACHYV